MADMLWLVSASGFALATSISPGPVNLLTLSATLRGHRRESLAFISGATAGFTLQLLLLGLLMQPLFAALPWLADALHWGGIAFLLWMTWLLWHAGASAHDPTAKIPGFRFGALLQWLNPKAYLVIAAAVGLYVGRDLARLYALAAIYAVLCWLSLAAWIALGLLLRRHMQSPRAMRLINRALALLLLASIAMMG